jgi:hypothetical protein
MRGIRWVAASFFLLFSGAALADPPDRVGRLSYVEGSVSIRGPEEDGWGPARLNWPVTSGSAVWTEPGGRAEIQVGAVTMRVDQETELNILRLEDDRMELAVPQGAANIHVPLGASVGPIWISTATGPVTISAPGFYSVIDGEIRTITAPQTPFDQWAASRAQSVAAAQAETLRHVSPQMTGYQDLVAHGAWTVTPDYGAVWYPHAVPAGWAPYRYGHWEYIAPWGWTWIDDTRWGFAPFHYGRWVLVHGRWAWWPGRREPRPVYAPALVVFIGIGGGHDHHHHRDRHHRPHRWVPLAPHEHFRPYYRASDVHVRNVNRTTVNNVTVVNNSVNVERLVNRNAASSLRRSEVVRAERRERAAAPPSRIERRDVRETRREERPEQRRAAPASVAAPAGPAAAAPPLPANAPRRELRDDRRREREERRAVPAPIVAPTPAAATPTQTPAPRREVREERRRERDEHRAAPPPAAAPMAAPAPVERPRIVRPEAPATERREAREERRNPRETRIAPPVVPREVQPRLAPPSATREAVRQRERAQPGAVQAHPAPAPRAERAPTRSPAAQPQAAPQREMRERRGDNPQRKRGDGPPPKG